MITSRLATAVSEIKSDEEIKSPLPSDALNLKIQKAAKSATSNLAVYIFKKENHANFAKLFAAISPEELVLKLNKINMQDAHFKLFKSHTSHQEEYAELFDLPPLQWLAILTEEIIHGEDLTALIASSDIGAVSGMLSNIEELPDPVKKAKILFFLNHSTHATDREIKAFFDKIGFMNESILPLYFILHNVRTTSEGFTRPATEAILRIHATNRTEPENQARVKAALRIMHECLDNHYKKALMQLSEAERIKIQIEHDQLLAKQLDPDAKAAKKLSQQLNGELSFRDTFNQDSKNEEPSTFNSTRIIFFAPISTLPNGRIWPSFTPQTTFFQFASIRPIYDQKHTSPTERYDNDAFYDPDLQKAIELSLRQHPSSSSNHTISSEFKRK